MDIDSKGSSQYYFKPKKLVKEGKVKEDMGWIDLDLIKDTGIYFVGRKILFHIE